MWGSSKQSAAALVLLAFSVMLLTGGAAGQSIFGANDDLSTWTDLADITAPGLKTSYASNPNATLIGNLIDIANASSSYTLVKPGGGNTGISGSSSLSTDNLSTEGRYTVNDTRSAKAHTRITVDVLRNTSDVSGRVINKTNSGSFSLGSSEVVFRNWLDKSKIKTGSVSTIGNGVDVFHANVSADKYWVGVEKSGWEKTYDQYHTGNKPRLNDIFLEQAVDTANVSILVRNYSASPSTPPRQGGIEVKLRRMAQSSGRTPYLTGPPTLTKISNSNGWANFTRIPEDQWDVSIANTSIARNKYSGFSADIPGPGSQDPSTRDGNSYTKTIKATHWTGNVSGELEGAIGPSYRYGIGAINRKKNRQFLKIGVSPGKITFAGLPNGSYKFLGAQFDSSKQVPAPKIGGTDVTVEYGKEASADIGFPATVKLNGTVYNSSSSPREKVSNVKIFMFNRTDTKFEQLASDSNGEFSGEVANSTLYNVKLIPPRGTDYKITSRQINVNGSGTRLDHNLSFKQGAVLEGYVKQNNNGLDAEVRVWNGSEKSYGFNVTTKSGYYKVNGLDPGKYHSVSVYTSKAGVSDNKSFTVNTPSGGKVKTQDFTFGQDNATLGGNVTDGNGKAIDVDVKVLNSDIGVDQTNSSGSNGHYNFTSLPKNTFYRVRAGVGGSGYVQKEKQLTLFKNTTLDFQLNKRKFVDGYVRNASDSSTVGSGFRVIARNGSQESTDSVTTNASGYYNLTLENLNYSVEVLPPEGSDYTKNETSFDASTASSGKHALLVASGKTLDGFILQNSTGNVIDDRGELFLWNTTKDVYRSADIDSDGDFNFTGLKNIDYNIAASSDNSSYEPNSTALNSGQLGGDYNVRLHLNTGRSIRVTVKDNDTDEIVSGAKVILGGDQQNSTDGSGNALFPRQTIDKSLKVLVEKSDYTSNTENFTVKDRKNTFGSNTDILEYQNITVNLDNPTEIDVDVNVTKNSFSGTPVSDAVIQLRANKSGVSHKASGVTGSNGETRLNNMVEGHQAAPDYTGGYLLTLATQDGETYTNETGIVKGETDKITAAGGKYRLMVEVPAK